MVPGGGVEPPWGCPRGILSPVRLPVSPSRHASIFQKEFIKVKVLLFSFYYAISKLHNRAQLLKWAVVWPTFFLEKNAF